MAKLRGVSNELTIGASNSPAHRLSKVALVLKSGIKCQSQPYELNVALSLAHSVGFDALEIAIDVGL